MATNQEGRHAGFNTLGGAGTFNEAVMSGATAEHSVGGTYNERLLAWINADLLTSHANINEAMHDYAVTRGSVLNWNSLASL